MLTPKLTRLALLTALTAAGCRPAADTTKIVYSTPRYDTVLTLDIDLPPDRSRPAPVIVFLMPIGSWEPSFKNDSRCQALYSRLAAAGYAVVTPHYRILGNAPFPAQIEDAKAAVRWVRENAARYGLDTERIGVIGASAGGALGLHLGTTGVHDQIGSSVGPPCQVQAVVGLGVPADLSKPEWSKAMEEMYLRPYLGKSFEEDPELYERVSPGHYATADDPPFLLFHSRKDILVPIALARTFANRLRAAGVPVTLVESDYAEHAWTGNRLDWAIQRSVEFFDQHLRGIGSGPTDLVPPSGPESVERVTSHP